MMYNDFMDELEYAADCGYDAICVNEHHSNGYGLMPSPNLIATSLARRTTDATICVMGNSMALYNPPTRVAEEFAMIDVHLRRAADRRLPGRHADGRLFRLRPEPEPVARALLRSARPGDEGVAGPRHLRLQRPLQPAALCEHLAAPDAAAASADLDSRRRLDRDLAVVRARWTTSTAISRITATRPARRRWTGSGPKWTGSARTATRIAPASPRPSPWRKAATRHGTVYARRRSISSAAACTSIRVSPPRPAIRPRRHSAPA